MRDYQPGRGNLAITNLGAENLATNARMNERMRERTNTQACTLC